MATFKSKMRHLEPDWPDQIWSAALAHRDGKGAGWLLPLAALAVTGVRPASLEKGIVFKAVEVDGVVQLQAIIKGAKILKDKDGNAKRGQDEVVMSWRLLPGPAEKSHRAAELEYIKRAVKERRDTGYEITIRYDADAISTRLRELSRALWPRKRTHVSGVCYRELFASTAKAAGVPAAELAAAMGHLSAESQGKYASRPRRRGGAVKPVGRPFGKATASSTVRTDRAPMARFKRSSAIAKAKARKP